MTEAPYPTGGSPDAHVEVTDRFALIPEALLYDPAISAEAVRLYGALRRHGSDPSNCYPSHRRLGDLIGRSPKSVPTWLRQLDEAGWIDRVTRRTASGDPDSNGYRVHGRAQERAVPAVEQGGVPAGEQGGSLLENTPKESNGKRAIRNENPARARSLALTLVESPAPPDPFAEFWSVYPYKRGSRAAAERAWKRATKIAPPVVILDGARRFAEDPNLPPKSEERFIRHGSTWLRDRGWEDGPLPPRGRPSSAAPPQQRLDTAREDAGQWELVDGEWTLGSSPRSH